MHKQAKYLPDTHEISTTLFWLCSVHVLSLPSNKEECDFARKTLHTTDSDNKQWQDNIHSH